jgi:hypothetical protein
MPLRFTIEMDDSGLEAFARGLSSNQTLLKAAGISGAAVEAQLKPANPAPPVDTGAAPAKRGRPPKTDAVPEAASSSAVVEPAPVKAAEVAAAAPAPVKSAVTVDDLAGWAGSLLKDPTFGREKAISVFKEATLNLFGAAQAATIPNPGRVPADRLADMLAECKRLEQLTRASVVPTTPDADLFGG